MPGERLWVCLPRADGARGAGAHERSPQPLPEEGEGSEHPPGLHPPRCSQCVSSCSGHLLLMIEMFDWAKFPTRMLGDGIAPHSAGRCPQRSAFTESSPQPFASPSLDSLRRTAIGRGSGRVPPRQHRVDQLIEAVDRCFQDRQSSKNIYNNPRAFQFFFSGCRTAEMTLEREGRWGDGLCCGLAAASRALETAEREPAGCSVWGLGGSSGGQAIVGSTGMCLGDQGFTAAFREHSCADPTAGHMLGSAVPAPLGSAAVAGDTFTLTNGSHDPVTVINTPVPLKPILAPKKAISTRVFSTLGLANGLFLDCYLEKKNSTVLKGKINTKQRTM